MNHFLILRFALQRVYFHFAASCISCLDKIQVSTANGEVAVGRIYESESSRKMKIRFGKVVPVDTIWSTIREEIIEASACHHRWLNTVHWSLNWDRNSDSGSVPSKLRWTFNVQMGFQPARLARVCTRMPGAHSLVT